MNVGKLMIFGDSYSTYAGYIPDGYLAYYTGVRTEKPDLEDVKETWWWRFIEATGATLVQNNSWSGSTIGYTGYSKTDYSRTSSFIYRFEKLLAEGFFKSNEIDTVLVFGGTNDSWCDAPLGEVKDAEIKEEDLYFALPAITHFAARLKAEIGEKQIAFIINDGLKAEITDCLKNACLKNGFRYVEISEVDKIEGHPTKLGMEQIANQVINALA